MNKLLFTTILCASCYSNVQAGVISQETASGAFQYDAYEQFWQSFTTIDSNITFSLNFHKFNDFEPYTDNLIARLYDGEGFGGSVLGTESINLSVTSEGPDEQWLDFDFTDITLFNGSIYTVGFVTDGSSSYGGTGIAWYSNPYSGGAAYYNDELSMNGDLKFCVTGESAVPEPSSLSLLLFGIIGVGFVRRCKQHT